MFDKCIKMKRNSNNYDYIYNDALIIAIDIAGRCLEYDKLNKYINLYIERLKNKRYHLDYDSILLSRKVIKKILNGFLNKYLDVTINDIQKYKNNIENGIDIRFNKGRQNIYSTFPLKKIVENINLLEIDLQTKTSTFNPEIYEGYIINIEKKINKKVPEDYKEFLKISNNLGKIQTTINPELLMDKIKKRKSAYFNFLLNQINEENNDNLTMENLILISDPYDEREIWLWLILSEKSIDCKVLELQMWNDLPKIYTSFREYLETSLQGLTWKKKYKDFEIN